MAHFENTPELAQLIGHYFTDDDLNPISEAQLDIVLRKMNAIQDYAEQKFPGIELLTTEQICMLTLSIRADLHTPEQAVIAEQDALIEVKRALSRFYSLQLLLSGIDGYSDFISPQATDNPYLPPLNAENYYQLSQQFKEKPPLSLACLKVSTLIASVPLSTESKKVASHLLGAKYAALPLDSVEFPAKIFENIDIAKKVYPLVQSLFDEYPDDHAQITRYLKNHFPSAMHYRHQLYTEGNKNMFAALVNSVRAGTMTLEDYREWRDYWTLNIVGFRGHVNKPNGSLYLTDNTYQGMKTLESVLEPIFKNKKITPEKLLNNYLAKRAQFLGLDAPLRKDNIALLPDEQKMLAHLGAMLRLFHPREGLVLIAGYRFCQPVVKELATFYFDSDPTEPTPTYAPAFFDNAVQFRLKHYGQQEGILGNLHNHPDHQTTIDAENLKRMLAYADAVIACLPLYLKALEAYKAGRQNGIIPAHLPLSFQEISGIDTITALFEKSPIMEKFNILDYFEIAVNEQGKVMCKMLPQHELAAFAKQHDSLEKAITFPPAQPSLLQQFTNLQQQSAGDSKRRRASSLSPESERVVYGKKQKIN